MVPSSSKRNSPDRRSASGTSAGRSHGTSSKGRAKFVPSWDVYEDQAAITDPAAAAALMRGVLLPADRDAMARCSSEEMLEDLAQRLYQCAVTAMGVIDRHRGACKSNEQLRLEAIKKDGDYNKVMDEHALLRAKVERDMEGMRAHFEKINQEAEARALKADELQVHAQMEAQHARNELATERAKWMAEAKKTKKHVTSLIVEAKRREQLLSDALETAEAEKLKALDEEREKVLDRAADMLWDAQKKGFELGVRVVADNFPDLRGMGINVLELIESPNEEDNIFGDILSREPVKGSEGFGGGGLQPES